MILLTLNAALPALPWMPKAAAILKYCGFFCNSCWCQIMNTSLTVVLMIRLCNVSFRYSIDVYLVIQFQPALWSGNLLRADNPSRCPAGALGVDHPRACSSGTSAITECCITIINTDHFFAIPSIIFLHISTVYSNFLTPLAAPVLQAAPSELSHFFALISLNPPSCPAQRARIGRSSRRNLRTMKSLRRR